MRQRFARLIKASLVLIATLVAVYVVMLMTAQPFAPHRFFDDGDRRPLVFAHRGGAGLRPENTLVAFARAVELKADVLETDVHATRDGTLVLIHDGTVDRTTNGTGDVSDLTLEELKRLDAGCRWTEDDGKTYPFRGTGVRIPTLEEAFETFPNMRFNIEIKRDSAIATTSLCEAIRRHEMTDKVIVAAVGGNSLEEFRGACAEVATSASASEVSTFLALSLASLEDTYSPAAIALQVPERLRGVQIVNGRLIEAAHKRNMQVHVWTINDPARMRALLELGVDGIVTDYPDRLMKVLE